jgi:SAM-dependent methyltransferase
MTIANRDQAEHWNDADEAGHWVDQQVRYDTMLAPFIDMILGGAQLSDGDVVLDVGCGCGATTLAAGRAVGAGRTHGVDLSAPMLERARADAARAGLGNVTFEQADAQVHAFGAGAFDRVVSRFGIMFFDDPVAAFGNLRVAARRGGRLAFVCWQPLIENQWLVVPGAALATVVPMPDLGQAGPGMFALADPQQARQVLGAAGWSEVSLADRRTPILVGGTGTLDDAVAFLRTGSLGRTVLKDVDPDTEAKAIDAVRAALLPHSTPDGVRLEAAVWLVTAVA